MRVPVASEPVRVSRQVSSLLMPRWQRLDWPVFCLALALLGVGMVLVAAMAEADERGLRDGISFSSHLKKVAFALPALGLGLSFKARWLRRHAYVLYGLSLCLLAVVPFIGIELNNARRWIALPLLNFDLQPSELAKPALIAALAAARQLRFGTAQPARCSGQLEERLVDPLVEDLAIERVVDAVLA